ncbi:hypothetical protein EDB80DRAFT_694706 [Ilyonectria destructans]|nr:hypothetical protein EDB80DRAFT_694706 [Ilyonectria destructans]
MGFQHPFDASSRRLADCACACACALNFASTTLASRPRFFELPTITKARNGSYRGLSTRNQMIRFTLPASTDLDFNYHSALSRPGSLAATCFILHPSISGSFYSTHPVPSFDGPPHHTPCPPPSHPHGIDLFYKRPTPIHPLTLAWPTPASPHSGSHSGPKSIQGPVNTIKSASIYFP